MSESFIFDKLSLLNNIYNQSLPEITKPIEVATIKTKLYPHQLRMVHGMNVHREKLIRGFLSDNQAINGKIGIIGDGAGTGKTLSVLAYIAAFSDIFPRMTCELSNHSSTYFFSHEIHPVSDSSTNLIIVPHYLYQQWNHEIQKHTKMKYCGIETRRMLKDGDMAKKIVENDFTITTNKCYKHLQEYAMEHGIQWNNVFIDEASSIYIKASDPPIQFQFLWFITNNWIPLIFKNPSLSKNDLYHLRDRIDMNVELKDWLEDNQISHYESNLVSSAFFKDYLPFLHKKRYVLVLRNSYQSTQQSMPLPICRRDQITCRPNITMQSLSTYFLSRSMSPQFNIEKIPYIFQILNIDCKTLIDYLDSSPPSVHNLIRRKVQENECVICLEKAEYTTIVNCCYHTYCGKCLLTRRPKSTKSKLSTYIDKSHKY